MEINNKRALFPKKSFSPLQSSYKQRKGSKEVKSELKKKNEKIYRGVVSRISQKKIQKNKDKIGLFLIKKEKSEENILEKTVNKEKEKNYNLRSTVKKFEVKPSVKRRKSKEKSKSKEKAEIIGKNERFSGLDKDFEMKIVLANTPEGGNVNIVPFSENIIREKDLLCENETLSHYEEKVDRTSNIQRNLFKEKEETPNKLNKEIHRNLFKEKEETPNKLNKDDEKNKEKKTIDSSKKKSLLSLEKCNSFFFTKKKELKNIISDREKNFIKSLNLDDDDSSANKGKKLWACNCRKTKCLKLYCDCFRFGKFCVDCNCVGCENVKDNKDLRDHTISIVQDRNPTAFRSKLEILIKNEEEITADNNLVKPDLKKRHMIGCNCKKSNCIKKYCECYQNNVKCTDLCKCDGCQNFDEDILKQFFLQNERILSENAKINPEHLQNLIKFKKFNHFPQFNNNSRVFNFENFNTFSNLKIEENSNSLPRRCKVEEISESSAGNEY